MRGLLDQVKHERAASAKAMQREAKHHREQQHLQHLALGKCVHDRRRNDAQQEVHRALHLARPGVGGEALGVERIRVNVHANAGLNDIHNHEANDQRNRTYHLEIQERHAAGFADFFHVLHAGNADDHRAENDRRDDHLDQLDEAIAEGLHRLAILRREMPQQHANHDSGDDLKIQRLVNRFWADIGVHVTSFSKHG